jgi:hypothetical protein
VYYYCKDGYEVSLCHKNYRGAKFLEVLNLGVDGNEWSVIVLTQSIITGKFLVDSF